MQTPSAEEWYRLRSSDNPAERGLAVNMIMPESVWAKVIDLFPESAIWVAQATQVPLATLDRLSVHPDISVREWVATRRKAAPLLDRMAHDSEPSVRSNVAYNAKVSTATLMRLCNDPDPLVHKGARYKLAQREARESDRASG